MQKIKVERFKTKWKDTDTQMDIGVFITSRPTFLANAVCNDRIRDAVLTCAHKLTSQLKLGYRTELKTKKSGKRKVKNGYAQKYQ